MHKQPQPHDKQGKTKRAKRPSKQNTDKASAKETNQGDGALEGEGSYTAGRRYDADATQFAESGAVEGSAREAKDAIERDPGEFADAEREGKRGPMKH